ncbi:MAG: hypothetical protein ABLQ96_03135, partial [Candidatus Acidiferrum sp.]
ASTFQPSQGTRTETAQWIDGLWALVFGNDSNNALATTLYFTAGPDKEKNGLFGTLTPDPNEQGDGDEQ